MNRVSIFALALALVTAAGARSQQPGAGPGGPGGPERAGGEADPLGRFLFPPELVMQQQRAIGLKPEQRAAITRAIQEFQTKLIDLRWQLEDETQRLAELLDRPTVDQAAALAQVDRVLAVEREVKRAHLALMIQIKDTLTPDQQAKLAQARAGGEGPLVGKRKPEGE